MISSVLTSIAVSQTNHVLALRLHSSVENLYLELEKLMKMYLENFFLFTFLSTQLFSFFSSFETLYL